MIKDDELAINEFLWERPKFFIRRNSLELEKLQQIGVSRGGIYNPYGIPIPMLGWIANIRGVTDYLSGIFQSVPGKNPTDFITWWAKTWIDQILHKVMSCNGNALEWFMLEMLIQTKNHEKSFFERPPLELDMYYATDLLYSSPFGLKAKGKTVGIQITSTHYKTKRFQEKRKKIREVNSSLINSQRKLKIFWHKRPDAMAIVWIYGQVWKTVIEAGNKVFCHDLWLPIEKERIPLKESIVEESKDIADFIRMSINTWNAVYHGRKKHRTMQKITKAWRDGNYVLEWRYDAEDHSTQFFLKKEGIIMSFFEILDVE